MQRSSTQMSRTVSQRVAPQFTPPATVTTAPPPPSITACILARNEENRIEDALRSLMGWADQIVVLDNESTDGTAELAKRYGALVLPVRSPGAGVNFDALRNAVIEHAIGDWILYIDADERIPPRLGPILKDLIASRGHEFEALVLPFKHYFCGRWMRHCGWWPGYTRPQLVKKGRFRYNERLHTGVEVEGRTFYFPAEDPDLAIVHFSYDNLDHYLGKLNRYTDGEAENLLEEGGSHSWQTQLAHFVHDWHSYYNNGHAYEDGMHGFVLAFLSAFYRFESRAKLWDIRRQRGEIVNPTEPVPPSLHEAVAFMRDVAANGAEPWLKKRKTQGSVPSRLVPAEWQIDRVVSSPKRATSSKSENSENSENSGRSENSENSDGNKRQTRNRCTCRRGSRIHGGGALLGPRED